MATWLLGPFDADDKSVCYIYLITDTNLLADNLLSGLRRRLGAFPLRPPVPAKAGSPGGFCPGSTESVSHWAQMSGEKDTGEQGGS